MQAVILTALRAEYQSVREHLSNPKRETHKGTIYEVGDFSANGRTWKVAIAEIGPHNESASREAERAINHYDPRVVLFVGVAGGLKSKPKPDDAVIGDVIAATKIYGYESGKSESGFLIRPEVYRSSYELEQLARFVGRGDAWTKRIKPKIPYSKPKVIVAPIAAGPKVIASTKSLVYRFIRSHYNDALAVEMEGLGFLSAVHANQDVEALIIRGISDLIDDKEEDDAKGSQDLASRNAAAFAFEILATLDPANAEKKISIEQPYRGLSAFNEKDSRFFFGRQNLIEELAKRLRQNPRFLAVVGSSGSGKSSVVQAGLFPILRRGDLLGFKSVKIIRFRPGYEPLEAMGQAMREENIYVDKNPWQDLQYYLENENSIERLVIFADQFEELFAYSKEPEKTKFIQGISNILKTKLPITLILTIRADFYDPLLSSPLGESLGAGQINIFPMSEKEIGEAITKPAETAGLMIESELDKRIIDDLKGVKQPLPLLEFALSELWRRGSNDGLLTHKSYTRIGGAGGALGLWATEAFSQLNYEEKKVSRHIFERLIHYGYGDIPDCRHRLVLSELNSIGDSDGGHEITHKLIKKLADSRLLVTDRDPRTGESTVEIIHEALLWEWRDLQEWINEKRTFLLWRQRFLEKLQEWKENKKEESCFLQGSPLEDAEGWLDKHRNEFTLEEYQFIVSSKVYAKKIQEIRDQSLKAYSKPFKAIKTILGLDVNLAANALADSELKLAEQEIIRLNGELEGRIAQRTKELETAKRELQFEVQERTQAEAVMMYSEHKLADIIRFLPDATFVIDKEGRVIAWNRAIEKMTGLKAIDILGKGGYEYSLPFYGERRPILIDLVLKPCLDFERAYESIKRHDDNTIIGESFIPDLNGKAIYLLGSAAVLYDSEGKICGAIESIRDITERKMAEEDLKSARDRAESATEFKSKFLANMSHEIRTPMNAVIGMTGLLLETDLHPEQRDYLETIRNCGNSLLSVTSDILDISNIDRGKVELECRPFDLLNCIEVSMDHVALKAAEKGLELIYLEGDGVPRIVTSDEIRLKQILLNLLENAVKFTERGEIILSLNCKVLPSNIFELHFMVKDTGIGISEESMLKHFQSFSDVDSSTMRRSYGGAGLGLAICRHLVSMMGGVIWVESETGIGSTFNFTIITERNEPENDERTQTSSALEGKRILIVDDNENMQNMLVRTVMSWEMESKTAASGKEALDILRDGTTFDAILLDEVMPGTDIQSLINEIVRIGIKKPLIMICPLGTVKNNFREIVISGWLTKPIKPSRLCKVLNDILSPSLAPKNALKAKKVEDSIQNLSILLAEDNLVNQKVALTMLRKLGYRADVACSGLEVLQAFVEKHYDVVLMDILMPDMDGLEATRRIRGSGIKTWIIAMTAYALKGDRKECLDAGMNEYITKPIKMEELQNALDRAFLGESILSAK